MLEGWREVSLQGMVTAEELGEVAVVGVDWAKYPGVVVVLDAVIAPERQFVLSKVENRCH